MTAHPDSVTVPVGVVVERRRGATPWAEWVWRPVAVLLDLPEAAPWTVLRDEGEAALFYAGSADITLFPTDTDNYRHTLQQEPPLLWVVLRPDPSAPVGWRLQAVTVDAGEAEIYGESPADLLEALPLPAPLVALLEDYVARHHKERIFHKRKRDRANPEALAQRRPGGAEEAE
jgi:hypothetical protein